MNKLIKWVTDLYYTQQRKPDEPEITYQEPVAEKDPFEGHELLYYGEINFYMGYRLAITTDYKVLRESCNLNIVQELDMGIPVISLMKYIDKMFAKMEVTCERIDGVDYYQVGEYRFSGIDYNTHKSPLSEIYKTIELTCEESTVLLQCLYWNMNTYDSSVNKQARQAMEDKLQGLLKDLEE